MDAFKAVTSAEMKTILRALHEAGEKVLFKFEDSAGIHRFYLEDRIWGSGLWGPRPATLSEGRNDQAVTANFSFAGEMYFFRAKVRLQARRLHLELDGPLSRLARRRSMRLKVPASLALNFVTKRFADRVIFERGTVQDLSLKGGKVHFPGNIGTVKTGDHVTGELRFGARKPIVVSAIMRHGKKPNANRIGVTLGLEFMRFDDPARFQSWLVELHREVYARQFVPS